MKLRHNNTITHKRFVGKHEGSLSPVKVMASILIIVVASFSLTGCRKYCVCNRYTSALDTFTLDELDEKGYTCSTIENIDNHDTYAVCHYE